MIKAGSGPARPARRRCRVAEAHPLVRTAKNTNDAFGKATWTVRAAGAGNRQRTIRAERHARCHAPTRPRASPRCPRRREADDAWSSTNSWCRAAPTRGRRSRRRRRSIGRTARTPRWPSVGIVELRRRGAVVGRSSRLVRRNCTLRRDSEQRHERIRGRADVGARCRTSSGCWGEPVAGRAEFPV